MIVPNSYPIDIVTIEPFLKRAARLLTAKKLLGLRTHLALNPEAGKIIPGTGGMRKLRWGLEGRGKRGGARVIYYYRDLNMPLFLVAIYAKNEQANLSSKEKKQMSQLIEQLVRIHCSQKTQKWANIIQMVSANGS